ncbi:ead/Ea22-like family protein, partial [Salmonella enterica subsp. enterica serovar Typhimurium]|nr:ead/Ea22-like family protein [Salmonella enterica subsp. enterica serovar Typhimurium]
AHTVEKRDAEFIAAANPATVLALLDVRYEFGEDEVAISEYVTNLEDALRVAAAPQQEE